ncbi:MAG: hypothetical protein V4547_16770 [Bacteroidota bacterium]
MSNKIRCIHYSNENGSKEGVIFTADMDAEPNEFIPHGCTLDSETEMDESDFPSAFPFEYNLERQ